LLSTMSKSIVLPHRGELSDLVVNYLADPRLRQEYIYPQKYGNIEGLLYKKEKKLMGPDGKLRLMPMNGTLDAIISGHVSIEEKHCPPTTLHLAWDAGTGLCLRHKL
jgi:hypothetical protein